MKPSIWRIIATVLAWWVVFGCGVPDSSGEPPADPLQSPFEKLSGRELVRQLPDDQTRSRAFYELARREIAVQRYPGFFGRDEGFELFVRSFPAAGVRICPQGDGRLPIYLVTFNRYGRNLIGVPEKGPLDLPRPFELFPPLPAYRQPPVHTNARGFRAFTGEGRWAFLFSDFTFSEENLGDLMGDGRVEYVFVDDMVAAPEGVKHVTVLRVATVEEKPKCLLTLLLNWGADEWTHRLRDADGDGVPKLELGPHTAAGIRPQVVFRWDAKAKAFDGPKAKAGDHFRILKNDWDIRAELDTFARSGESFPPEAGAVRKGYTQSLEALTEEEKARWVNFPNQFPADFWGLEPKAAALAFAEANRSDMHRARFRIALEDRDGASPPETGSVALSEREQGCCGGHSTQWFLRFEPGKSFVSGAPFIQARYGSADRGSGLFWTEVPSSEARHLAAVLWWLDRIRTFPNEGRLNAWSTTSHSRRLVFRDGTGAIVLERAGAISAPRWDNVFTTGLYLEGAAWLMAWGLPRRTEPVPPASEQPVRRPTPGGETAEAAAWKILQCWTPGETHTSHGLAAAALSTVDANAPKVAKRAREMAAYLPPTGLSKEQAARVEYDPQSPANGAVILRTVIQSALSRAEASAPEAGRRKRK